MKKFITLVILILFPVSVYALDQSHSVENENLTSQELRDKKVYDAMLGSEKKQDFSLYKLNYAILNDEDLLLQYSFKYRVIDELYLAFTNLILWDIYHDEMPAEDNNFMPEMFYRFMLEKDWLVSIDAGWFHRSNGSAGPTSRAWDRWQLRFNKAFKWQHMDVLWRTTLYRDIKKSKNNDDINDYHGPWDIQLTLRNLLGNSSQQLDLSLKLESGDGWTDLSRGQKVVGLHYRLPFEAFKPTLYLQYFNGYGEIIKNYNIETESLRFGLSFYY